MQLTESVDAPSEAVDGSIGFRLKVLDALFEAKGIHGISAQARALGLWKSNWIRHRSGEVRPLGELVVRIAEFLDVSTGAIYGRIQ